MSGILFQGSDNPAHHDFDANLAPNVHRPRKRDLDIRRRIRLSVGDDKCYGGDGSVSRFLATQDYVGNIPLESESFQLMTRSMDLPY